MNVHSALREIGLHKSEISVYVYLLHNGPSTVLNVSHGTNIARTNCYSVIRGLLKKKLISKSTRDVKTVFQVDEINNIKKYIESKQNVFDEIKDDLFAEYSIGSLKPIIRFYLSPSDISNLLNSVINVKGLIFCGPKPVDPLYISNFYNILSSNTSNDVSIIISKKMTSSYYIIYNDTVLYIPVDINPIVTSITSKPYKESILELIK